jgi:hypothetical protein
MIDKYTKAVLTAIATSLMVLVWQQHTTRFAFWLSQLDEKLYNLTLIKITSTRLRSVNEKRPS